MQLKAAQTDDDKKLIKEKIAEHHKQADEAYLKKKDDKEGAKNDETKKCYTFDLQQCLPTPYINSSVSFYKRQLWTYNLTMHETSSGCVRCYMWHEAEGERGANQIATCIYNELIKLPENVEKVTLYSDSCGGQNRNSHVAAMFLVLMQNKPSLQQIDHKFMVSGHSHLECDVDHANIEKQKKKRSHLEIAIPHDWYQLVRTVGKKKKFEVIELTHSDFLKFSELMKSKLSLRKKDTLGQAFKWTEIRWLRYTREKGCFLFKCSLNEEEQFRCVSLSRRNSEVSVHLEPPRCYSKTLPISQDKKKDLLSILSAVNPLFHDFYKNLSTGSVKDILPDIEEFPED